MRPTVCRAMASPNNATPCQLKFRLNGYLIQLLLSCWFVLAAWPAAAEDGKLQVPVLLYHHFDNGMNDFMTVRNSTLESQLQVLSTRGYTVIPLRDLLEYRQGRRASLPAKSVVITVDDGHRSVYEVLFPLVQRYRFPVTLFIYPAAISNASWALTWGQLHTLQQSGLFDIQAHTYSHPDFAREQQRLSAQDYRQFVHMQLTLSKQLLEQHLGKKTDVMAWTFGYYDEVLLQEARNDGYVAAFTVMTRPVTQNAPLLMLPRFLMVERYDAESFAHVLEKNSMPDAPAALAGIQRLPGSPVSP